jgi:hypothetical protein
MADKENVLYRNAERFYGLNPIAATASAKAVAAR